jgi:site-specific DNA-methyltransferase (adenine-specific)
LWLRDYGVAGQLGLEPTFSEYIRKLCEIFDEIKRVLKKTGSIWVVLGDTYGGSNCGYGQSKESSGFQNVARQTYYPTSKRKPLGAGVMPKCLLQIPSRFAIEMCSRGWILRNEIIWHKPNCMPSSARDRFTSNFEKIYFFVRSTKYYFERQLEPLKESSMLRAQYGSYSKKTDMGIHGGMTLKSQLGVFKKIKEGKLAGRNKRCVWEVATQPFRGAHFATFPEKLIEPMIKAGCPEDGIVLDPFAGVCTVGVVAKKLGRRFVGIELNADYIKMGEQRIANTVVKRG